jgi:hypothetical protein
MRGLFVFSQLVMLGLISEYLGRLFPTVNQRPQAIVRRETRGVTARMASGGRHVPAPLSIRAEDRPE